MEPMHGFPFQNMISYLIASRIPPGLERKIDDRMEVWMDFGWLLDRLLADFGTKLAPSWLQRPFWEGWKTNAKKHERTGLRVTLGMDPVVPLMEQSSRQPDSRRQTTDSQTGRQQTANGLSPRSTPLVPCGHGGGFS